MAGTYFCLAHMAALTLERANMAVFFQVLDLMWKLIANMAACTDLSQYGSIFSGACFAHSYMARKYKYLANMAACIALRACQYGNIFQVRTFLIERLFCRAMDVQIQIDSHIYGSKYNYSQIYGSKRI